MRLWVVVLALPWLAGCAFVPVDARDNRSVCPVHGARLRFQTLQIGYGLYAWPKGYFEAEEREFPEANEFVGGGCNSPGPFGPAFAWVHYCPDCREARRRWLEEREGRAAPAS